MPENRGEESGLSAKKLWRFPAPAAWMWIIWRFSAQDAPTSGDFSDRLLAKTLERVSPSYAAALPEVQAQVIEQLSFYERKAAHMSLYFVLALLFSWALHPLIKDEKRRSSLAFGLCTLYAALDEFHQTFVSGRSGEVRDVCVDASGALIALVLAFAVTRLVSGRLPPGGALLIALVPAAALLGLCLVSRSGAPDTVIAVEALTAPVLIWFSLWAFFAWRLSMRRRRGQRFSAR